MDYPRRWNILLYFGIALECDSPILTALVQITPGLVAGIMLHNIRNRASDALDQVPAAQRDRTPIKTLANDELEIGNGIRYFLIAKRGLRLVVKFSISNEGETVAQLGRITRTLGERTENDIYFWFLCLCEALKAFIKVPDNYRSIASVRIVFQRMDPLIVSRSNHIS